MRKITPIHQQPRQPSRIRHWVTGGLALAVLCTGCSKPGDHALQSIDSPAALGSAEPHLARGADGTVVLSWLEPDGDGVALRYSALTTTHWRPAQTVARGDNWFVNWADFPSVTPIADDLWAAHWLAKSAGGTYAYDVAMALSTDGGQSWESPFNPHTDGTRTEHGFVSLFPWQQGVGAVWLDGRNTTADGHEAHGDVSAPGGMTLRSAVIVPNEAIPEGQLVDDLVCDCCQTDIALATTGPLVVYRNRTAEETRDIYVARAIDGRWRPGQAVADDGWTISGCPVNGPAIAASGDDVAVAWFTAANDTPRVQLVRSIDSAASFSVPIDIDVEHPVGRVDVELLADGTAVVSWLGKGEDGHGELSVRPVTLTGDVGPIHTIARLATARLSGFPQMVRDADGLVFAWTDTSDDENTVRTARLDETALGQ